MAAFSTLKDIERNMYFIQMRKFLALVAITFIAASCNQELIINAPWKDVSAIYGILDRTSDTNYIRVHRGYLGNEGINGGSQNPDSLYYINPEVKIEILNASGQTIETVTLIKDESKDLDSGFFTTEGYHTYRFDKALEDNFQYKLVIDKSEDGLNQVYATTPMVDDFNIDQPNANRSLAYTFRNGVNLGWESTLNGRLYEVKTRMHYLEMSLADNNDVAEKYVDFSVTTKLANTLNGGQAFVSTIDYDGYYRFLANNIEVNQDVIRFYQGTDIVIVASADDLATYMSVSAPATTVVQDKPHFTNIMGGDDANAGIFSAINKAQNLGMKLADDSMDSLVRSMLTCDLQFADRIGQDTVYCQGGILIKK